MKLTDFTLYNKAIDNCSQFELEIVSNSSADHEDRFMQFMRYIDMLDQTDAKKTEGKKFISMIFNIDKFKAYQNQSLHILDHES